MKKLFILDVDDTLVHWYEPFEGWLRAMHIPSLPVIPYSSYNLADLFQLDRVTFLEYVKEFNTSRLFYQLPVMNGAVEGVRRIKDAGFDVIALTCCGAEPEVHAGRRRNLELHFPGMIPELVTQPLGSSKKEFLEKAKVGYDELYAIDDAMIHAKTTSDTGYKTFLLNRLHNQEHDDRLIRIASWNDVRFDDPKSFDAVSDEHFKYAMDTMGESVQHFTKMISEDDLIDNVSRAIGSTAKMENHHTRARIVLKAVRGEWKAPWPSNPQDKSVYPKV